MARPTTARPRAVILLTGFGPFPGTPENVTSRLVPELARLAALRFRSHEVVSEILPTDWSRAPQRLEQLYVGHEPKVALHFGVSERASGFAVETIAHNRCANLVDVSGCLPSAPQVEASGPDHLATSLPVEAIVARLQTLGLPVAASMDAGSYLCNTIFYRTIRHAGSLPHNAIAGFIHVPPALGNSGSIPHAGARAFDWDVALLGSMEIIRVCLGRAPRLPTPT